MIRLQPLTPEEMLILIEKLADIHAGLCEYAQIVTQQDMGILRLNSAASARTSTSPPGGDPGTSLRSWISCIRI